MSERILVTGGEGYVMSSILGRWGKDMRVFAPSHERMDFTDLSMVRRFVKTSKCEVFIHAGAYTNTKKAREEFKLARFINGEGAKNVAIACEETNAKMILLSSDFVFPGNEHNTGPYTEDAKRPDSFTSLDIGYYGSSKLLSEFIAQKYCSNLAIIRLSYPFGCFSDKDYICKLIKTIESGYGLFEDQPISPAYLPDLAAAMRIIINSDVKGIFHVATNGLTTPYEIGTYVAKALCLETEVKKGSCNTYLSNPNNDIIPQFGGLNSNKTQQELGLKFHTWKEALDEYLALS